MPWHLYSLSSNITGWVYLLLQQVAHALHTARVMDFLVHHSATATATRPATRHQPIDRTTHCCTYHAVSLWMVIAQALHGRKIPPTLPCRNLMTVDVWQLCRAKQPPWRSARCVISPLQRGWVRMMSWRREHIMLCWRLTWERVGEDRGGWGEIGTKTCRPPHLKDEDEWSLLSPPYGLVLRAADRRPYILVNICDPMDLIVKNSLQNSIFSVVPRRVTASGVRERRF